MLDDEVMHDLVDLIGGDTDADVTCGLIECGATKLTCETNTLNLLIGVDMDGISILSEWLTGCCIVGSLYVCRYESLR